MGVSIIPLAAPIASAGLSAVRSAVDHLVGSVVGVFDPGKARDADREARAEMWYQLARQGSTYAGRHVLGGRTLVYTVKEKGYYEARWSELLTSNPTVAQQAQILGGVGIPDNPTDAEKTQMANEINAALAIAIPSAPAGGAYLTPSGNPGVAPVAQISPKAASVPTAGLNQQSAPSNNGALLYLGLGLAIVVAALLLKGRK